MRQHVANLSIHRFDSRFMWKQAKQHDHCGRAAVDQNRNQSAYRIFRGKKVLIGKSEAKQRLTAAEYVLEFGLATYLENGMPVGINTKGPVQPKFRAPLVHLKHGNFFGADEVRGNFTNSIESVGLIDSLL